MKKQGAQTVSRTMLTGLGYGGFFAGQYRRAAERRTHLKLVLQNSTRRKAPITLPTTPFDHRGETS